MTTAVSTETRGVLPRIALLLLLAIFGLCPCPSSAQSPLPIQWVYEPIYGTRVSYSPDGTLVAFGGEADTIGNYPAEVQLYSAKTGAYVRDYPTENTVVANVAFWPNGNTLAVGGSKGVELWNVATGELITRLLAGANTVAFSPDGKTAALGGGSVLQLYDVIAGKLTATLNTTGETMGLAFSPNGKLLAQGGGTNNNDGFLSVWNVATGASVFSLPTADTAQVDSISFSPDGSTLVDSGSALIGTSFVGALEFWNVSNGTRTGAIDGAPTLSVTFSPDGKTVAACQGSSLVYQQGDGMVDLWSVASGRLLASLQSSVSYIDSVAFSPNGASITDNYGETWGVSTDTLQTKYSSVLSAPTVLALAISPDGKTLVEGGSGTNSYTGLSGPSLAVWNLGDGQPALGPATAAGSVAAVAFSKDGHILIDGGSGGSGSQGGVLEFWNASTMQSLSQHNANPVAALACSPDGRYLAVGLQAAGTTDTLEIWNLASQTRVSILGTGANLIVSSVAFSPDGKTLAVGGTGSAGGVLELWNVSAGNLIASLNTLSTTAVYSVAFSPDGKTLADGGVGLPSFSGPGVVEFWSVADQTLLDAPLLSTTTYDVYSVAFSPDGAVLFAGTDSGWGTSSFSGVDSTLQAISTTDYSLVSSYDELEVGVNAVAVSPSGASIAYGTASGGVVVSQNPFHTKIISVSLSPASVVGGASPTVKVTLSQPAPAGGAGVALSSSNSATSPPTVVVPAGQTAGSGAVTTTPVSTTTVVTITGTYLVSTASGKLTIDPPALSAIAVTPTSLIGGANATGKITITGSAPAGGVKVALSSNSQFATVPHTVSIPAGASSTTFSIKTTPVAIATIATIEASVGAVTKKASLTVTEPALAGLSVSPMAVVGGSVTGVTGTVTLTGPSPAGGFKISLSSSNSAVTVPSSVIVPAAATIGTFSIKTTAVRTTLHATIKGACGNIVKTESLTVSPFTVSLAVKPDSVVGGSSSTGTVTLNAARGAPTVVAITSSSAAASVPVNVTIPANALSATFTISTQTVQKTVTATIRATYGSSTGTATLQIQT